MKPTVLQIAASDGPRVQGIDIQMKKVARIPLFPQTKTESQTDKKKKLLCAAIMCAKLQ